MSNQSSSYSYSTYTSSSSTGTNGNTTTGNAYAAQSNSDDSGTTIQTASQNLGEPVVQETRRYDSSGQPVLEGTSSNSTARIQDVSDEEAQKEKDRLYEERIELEYEKREGGA